MHVDIKLIDEISLKNVQDIFELSLEVGGGDPFPNLFTFRNKFVLPTKEAREWTASTERSGRAKAEAYVMLTLAQKIMGDFYIRLNKPVPPTKIFTNYDQAVTWLRKYAV